MGESNLASAKPGKGSLEVRWEELHRDRTAALNRKRAHAELTIPNLLPSAGSSQNQDMSVPFNSEAADGINNLASRMVSVMLPPSNLPVFEIFIDEKFNPEGSDTAPQKTMLARAERAILNRVYITNFRPQLFLALKHLIAIGDVLLYLMPNLDVRLYRFDEYVVARTTEGVWREIIIREQIDPALNPDLDAIQPARIPGPQSGGSDAFPRASGQSRRFEPLYTRLTRDGENEPVKIEMEFRVTPVNMDGDDTFEVNPYFPLRWNAVTGEDYGTSLVEDQFGDIRALDASSAGLLDGIAMASEFRWLVNPSGITEIEDLRQSVNGDWVPGVGSDVEPSNFQNSQQIAALLSVVQHRESKVGSRFLSNRSARRQAERVSAKEVAIIAEEIEQSLGGALTMSNRDLMIPYLKRTIFVLSQEEKGIFPKEFGEIIKDADSILKLRIRAGLELLQQEADREKLMEWLTRVVPNLPPQALRVYKWENIGRDTFVMSGLEPEGRVKSTEELAAEDEAAAQRQQAMAVQETAQEAALAAAKQAPANEGQPA